MTAETTNVPEDPLARMIRLASEEPEVSSRGLAEILIELRDDALSVLIDQIASGRDSLKQFSSGLMSLSVAQIDSVLDHLGQAGNFSQNKIQVLALVIKAKSIKTGKAATAIVMENKVKSGLGVAGVLAVLATLSQGVGLQDISKAFSRNIAPAASVATETVTAVAGVLPEIKLPVFTLTPDVINSEKSVAPVIASVPVVSNQGRFEGPTSDEVAEATNLTANIVVAKEAAPEQPTVAFEAASAVTTEALPEEAVADQVESVPFNFTTEDAVHAVPLNNVVSTNETPVTESNGISPKDLIADRSDGGVDLTNSSLIKVATNFDSIEGEERVPFFADLEPTQQDLVPLIAETLNDGGPILTAMFQSMGYRMGYGTSIDGSNGPQTTAHALATVLVCDKDFQNLCDSVSFYEAIAADSAQWNSLAVYLQRAYGSHVENLPTRIETKAALEATLLKIIKFATTTNDESVSYFAFDQSLVTALATITAEAGAVNMLEAVSAAIAPVTSAPVEETVVAPAESVTAVAETLAEPALSFALDTSGTTARGAFDPSLPLSMGESDAPEPFTFGSEFVPTEPASSRFDSGEKLAFSNVPDSAVRTAADFPVYEAPVAYVPVDASEIQTTAPVVPVTPELVIDAVGMNVTPDETSSLAAILSAMPAAPLAFSSPNIDTSNPPARVAKEVVVEKPAVSGIETAPSVTDSETGVELLEVTQITTKSGEIVSVNMSNADLTLALSNLDYGQAYGVTADGTVDLTEHLVITDKVKNTVTPWAGFDAYEFMIVAVDGTNYIKSVDETGRVDTDNRFWKVTNME